jgi:hypothetical protein
LDMRPSLLVGLFPLLGDVIVPSPSLCFVAVLPVLGEPPPRTALLASGRAGGDGGHEALLGQLRRREVVALLLLLP